MISSKLLLRDTWNIKIDFSFVIIIRFSQSCWRFRELKTLSNYRHIQLAANLCNEIQQQVLLPITIAGCTIVLGICLALVITSFSTTGNLFIKTSMGLISVEIVLYLIFGMRALAELHDESEHALHGIRTKLITLLEPKIRKWVQRYIRSCWPIKIKFGGTNFVDMLTPLNCIAHAVQITVHILLLGRSR